jgi:hypothetical protein
MIKAVHAAWAIYRNFVASGVIVGALSYGVFTIAGGYPFVPFLAVTVPLIVVFSLVVSLPLTGLALIAIRVLDRAFGPQPKQWWLAVGTAVGATGVLLALMCFVSVGALSNSSGRVFWLTFVLAGAIAGGRAGMAVEHGGVSGAA